MSSEEERERTGARHLEWRDYVAPVVASLETTLLPVLVMIAVLVLFALAVIRRRNLYHVRQQYQILSRRRSPLADLR